MRLLCEVFDLDYGRAQGIFFTEPMYDLNRKWALFDNGEMVSILTNVPLEFGWGRAIGIAGVATKESRRGQGLAGELLNCVMDVSARNGETGALLFAKETVVYDRSGFKTLDMVVRGTVAAAYEEDRAPILGFVEARQLYDAWSCANPNRLRRDEKRWNYWKWNLRVCTAHEGGYLCVEGSILREAVLPRATADWPVGGLTEWFGLKSMATQLGLTLEAPREELYLMGRNIPAIPQMFMTDQF